MFAYDTRGRNSQGISWLPSYRYLNRSMVVLAYTRLCRHHFIINTGYTSCVIHTPPVAFTPLRLGRGVRWNDWCLAPYTGGFLQVSALDSRQLRLPAPGIPALVGRSCPEAGQPGVRVVLPPAAALGPFHPCPVSSKEYLNPDTSPNPGREA